MTTISVTPMPPHEVEIHLAYEQLKTHAQDKFQYALTQSDIEELIFSDMWDSLEQFVEYMGQEGVSVGTPIQGTANCKPSPTTQLYSNDELAAMDALILPLDYAVHSRNIGEQIEGFERHIPLEAPNVEDIDARSIFTDYSGDALPLYDSVKLPSYQTSPIEHIYICNDEFSDPPKHPGNPSSTTDSGLEVQTRKRHFAKIHPRLSAKARELKDRLRFHRDTIHTLGEPTLEDSGYSSGERISRTRKLLNKLSHLSPQQALKRVRDTFRGSRFG